MLSMLLTLSFLTLLFYVIFRKYGLTYFIPHKNGESERVIPIEAANIENSRVLLFVIVASYPLVSTTILVI
jgi:hypothetical protein